MGAEAVLQPPASVASPAQAAYFERLRVEAERALSVARQARGQGWDPTLDVEIVLADDLAARVEAQTEIPGIAALVRKLTLDLKDRELVALAAARSVARGELRKYPDARAAIDAAVRTGLSILTEGILVAPLEGIAKVELGRNGDGSSYCDIYFAGPIRAAGGTAQAMSVLMADVVRRDAGVGRYIPTDAEIERYKEEVPAYKQAQHLQYIPDGKEIELIVRNCPVCINGEGTEKVEVSGHRDLPRVETNQLRGGAVLVLAEGLTQKAAKILKHVTKLGLEEWMFLEAFTKKKAAPTTGPDEVVDVKADDKFIQELIGGRPVLAHPSRPGGFRLRYGRGRTCGIASTAIHPVAMHAVGRFLAIGTQMKLERPGKGTIVTPCESLEGPMVLLDDGELLRVDTLPAYNAVSARIRSITDLGEILIPYGEFAENNASLVDASFTIEWWREILRARAGDTLADDLGSRIAPTFAEAISWSREYGVPLHPIHTLLWHDVEVDALEALAARLPDQATWNEGVLSWPRNDTDKALLISLACPHQERDGQFVVRQHADAFVACLGLQPHGTALTTATPRHASPPSSRFPAVAWVTHKLGVEVKPRAPTRIGARMGRPEKADVRQMSPPVHGLFPVGDPGGIQRDLIKACEVPSVTVEVGRRRCATCGRDSPWPKCSCGGHTDPLDAPPEQRAIPYAQDFPNTVRKLGLTKAPDKVKGVMGLSSRSKTPELLSKGILRAVYGISTFKDGTCRFDMTDAPLTHFRPAEIGTQVEKLRALGYTHDMHGAPLERPDQLLELRVQDVIPSRTCGAYLVDVAKFVDALLQRVYGLEPFYRVTRGSELVGHLVAGLAPHTSGAVLGRIIGYTDSQVCWAHPFFHTSKRRNADGDEDALMLLMDAFVNFSKAYIPDKRGSLMDLPLLLSMRIDPREIDKESLNVDTLSRYPLALYEAAEKHRPAKEVVKVMRLVESLVGTPAMYEGFGFTHDTPSIQAGPAESSYKTLGSMVEKMQHQLALATLVRAVDAGDVAGRVLSTHLLPDVLGNLKAFAKQKVRCTKCNAKYRRVPLGGVCTNVPSTGKLCSNPLTLTVPPAGVKKYLDLIIDLADKYPIPAYTKERVALIRRFVGESFAPPRFKKGRLEDFS